MRFALISTALVCLLAIPEALAQSPFELDRVTITPAVGFALDEDADGTLAVSGALAYPMSELFVVEGELGHFFDLAPDDAEIDSSLTTVHASLLYLFMTEFVAVPYLAAGIGFARFSHDVDRPPARIRATEVGFNLGGGVTYPIGDRAWFRGDFRFLSHIDDVPSAWRVMAGIALRVGEQSGPRVPNPIPSRLRTSIGIWHGQVTR